MHTSTIRVAAGLALTALPVLAQAPTKLPAELWRVPIHTAPADPVGGSYGTWAGGESFKASFHDGFRFYPVLGKAYPRNLPLAWRTASVRVGAATIVDGAEPAVPVQVSPWRYEYRHAGMTEAYDVRADGVEQTFVLAQRPAATGDLVVEGRVSTELVAADRTPRHAELTFCGPAGEELVRYGAAVAVDAAGARFPLATGYADGSVSIVVPAEVVASASYPLTIDPLLARVAIDTWAAASYGLMVSTSVARDDEATTRNVFTFWARNVSLSDYDAYGALTDDDFGSAVGVFSDLTTSWGTTDGDVTFVGGAGKFALALQRDFPGASTPYSSIRVYLHASGNTTLNSGNYLYFPTPSNSTDRNPAIGGVAGFASGSNALVVYTADQTVAQSNTPNTEVWAMLVDASAESFGTRFLLAPANNTGGRNLDREYPDVNQFTGPVAGDSWVVAWQELNNAVSGQSWGIKAVRVRQDGTIGGSVSGFLGASGYPHHIRPKLDGQDGRYLMTYLRTDTLNQGFAKQVETYRFDWPNGGSSTSVAYKQSRILTTSAANNLVQGGIAYDDNSDSHWAIVFQQSGVPNSSLYVRRVGYTGAITEAATLHTPSSGDGGHMPALTFDNDADRFQIVYNTLGTGSPLYGRIFTFPSNATATTYGTGCGGTIGAGDPYAGSELFAISLSGASASQNAALLLAGGSAAISLAANGMPSCFLNLNPALLVASVPVATSSGGACSLTFALPDAPLVTGGIFAQWAYVDPAAPWALKVRTTQGLNVQIH